MEEVQKYIQLLKKELESGRKSISSLKGKLKKLKMNGKQVALMDEDINDIITTLRNDEEIKVSRGGWFWSQEYLSFNKPAMTPKIKRPKVWVGVCPWPSPPNLECIVCDRIWLPHPLKYERGYYGKNLLTELFYVTDQDIENFKEKKDNT